MLAELETLDLSQNHLKRISGLQNCQALKTLILAQNRISEIANLGNNMSLEVGIKVEFYPLIVFGLEAKFDKTVRPCTSFQI